MLQNMIEGIVAAIEAEGEIPVYTKEVDETVESPYFHINCESGTSGVVVGRRTMRTYRICIAYHPSAEESTVERAQKMEELFDILGVIDADGSKFRGNDINGKMEDGILEVRATYAFYLLENTAETCMESVAINTNGNR